MSQSNGLRNGYKGVLQMKQDCSSNWHNELELSPNCWSIHAPREVLKPLFGHEDSHLYLMGNDNPYIFGYWRRVIDIEKQYPAYKISVKFKVIAGFVK